MSSSGFACPRARKSSVSTRRSTAKLRTRFKEAVMEILAFASFAILVVAWLVAPSRGDVIVVTRKAEDRKAA